MEQQVMDDPKINEALELLNKSAKEKKDQLQRLISDKYVNIRDAMGSYSFGATSAVRRNPWLFIGSVAAGFLTAGYMIGRIGRPQR